MVQGAELDGAGLAALVRRVVAALNARDIPTAGSLVEYFNRELVAACRDQFAARWGGRAGGRVAGPGAGGPAKCA